MYLIKIILSFRQPGFSSLPQAHLFQWDEDWETRPPLSEREVDDILAAEDEVLQSVTVREHTQGEGGCNDSKGERYDSAEGACSASVNGGRYDTGESTEEAGHYGPGDSASSNAENAKRGNDVHKGGKSVKRYTKPRVARDKDSSDDFSETQNKTTSSSGHRNSKAREKRRGNPKGQGKIIAQDSAIVTKGGPGVTVTRQGKPILPNGTKPNAKPPVLPPQLLKKKSKIPKFGSDAKPIKSSGKLPKTKQHKLCDHNFDTDGTKSSRSSIVCDKCQEMSE